MIDCSDLVVYIDAKSSASKRLIFFLQKAQCTGHSVLNYEESVDAITSIEGGFSLVPLIWNKRNNKIIVGCPIDFHIFMEKLFQLLEIEKEPLNKL